MDILDIIGKAKKLSEDNSGGLNKGKSKKKGKLSGSRSRVKVYKSITDALGSGYVGQIFTTEGSDRLYVITKRKWGTDKEQEVGGRVAKGFSPGYGSDFSNVKKYAVRTLVRHGKQRTGKFKSEKYWSRKQK